jgi:heme exporter protein C
MQGYVFRIIYYHVPSATVAFSFFAVSLVGSIVYLAFRRSNPERAQVGDAWALAGAEVGVIFNTVVLTTGPLWGRRAWGIWWTWDARLTSSFLLWVLFVSYLVLRTLVEEPERRALVSAVFGIFAALDIPLVYFSIWWFRTQHPQPVIGDGGKLDARMGWVLLLCWAATLGVMVVLIRLRYRLEALRSEVDALRMESARSTR